MADLDFIGPSLPVRPLGQEPGQTSSRQEPSAQERQLRRSAGAALTDDMGDRRDEPPLVDELA
jgi:hypothetical protein